MLTASEQAALVTEIRDCGPRDSVRRSVRVADLLRSVDGMLAVMARNGFRKRGSLELEDLIQAARLDIIRRLQSSGMGAFDAGRSDFVAWAKRVAWQAMALETETNAQAVHLSKHARVAGDRTPEFTAFPDTEEKQAALGLLSGDAETPEDAVLRGEMVRLVYKLPGMEQEVIIRHFGIGRDEESLRTIAVGMRIGTARASALLTSGLQRLRAWAEQCP